MPLFGKSAQSRVSETVSYVVDLCPPGDRMTITSFLNKWIAANIGAANMRAFSAELSTSGHAGAGDHAERAARRALVIISSNLLNRAHGLYQTADRVMSMPYSQVVQGLASLIPPFCIYALQAESNDTRLQTALTQLTTEPATFLRSNLVVCQSSGAPPGGVIAHQFLFDYPNLCFKLIPSTMDYLKGAILGNGLTINAVNVPEIYWANVPGRGANPAAWSFAGIVATPLSGATLMVTSAFSGCAFCFKRNAAGTFAAHVSPATPNDPSIGPPPTLATQLGGPGGTGNFGSPPGASAGVLGVFGRGFSNLPQMGTGYNVQSAPGVPLITQSMYIFGVCKNGLWRFYCQENNGAQRTVRELPPPLPATPPPRAQG